MDKNEFFGRTVADALTNIEFDIDVMEVMAIVESQLDVEELTARMGGVKKICPCGGTHCPGVFVENEDGKVLTIPTLAAIAQSRGVSLMDYLSSLLKEQERLVDEAMEVFDKMFEAHAAGAEDLPEDFLEGMSPEAASLVNTMIQRARHAQLTSELFTVLGSAGPVQ